jgi:hypothetical protein
MTIAASMRSLGIVAALVCGCEGADVATRPPAPPNTGRDGFANGCYVMDAAAPGSGSSRWLAANTPGDAYGFTASSQGAGARFVMRASDLGTYLLRDATGGYVVGAAHQLTRATQLQSDLELLDDTFRSPAEWNLAVAPTDPTRFQLRNYQTGEYLTVGGTSPTAADAATVAFYPATGCAPFPEMTLDAEGAVEPRTWPRRRPLRLRRRALAHVHQLRLRRRRHVPRLAVSPLGVEHALPSCEPFHGEDGRAISSASRSRASGISTPNACSPRSSAGARRSSTTTPRATPSSPTGPTPGTAPTHQTQYYRWLERAHRAGLRLVVQHATTNSVLCEHDHRQWRAGRSLRLQRHGRGRARDRRDARSSATSTRSPAARAAAGSTS